MYNEDINERLETAKSSYMTKEEFLKIIEEIEFIAVERCNMQLITSIRYNADEGVIETKSKGVIIN